MIYPDMRLHIGQNRPRNLNEAIRLAVEVHVDAYYKTEMRCGLPIINGKVRECDHTQKCLLN